MKLGEQKILNIILKSHSGMEVGSLYSKAKMEKGIFESNLERLANNCLVQIDDDFISITSMGRTIALTNLMDSTSLKKINTQEELYTPNLDIMGL